MEVKKQHNQEWKHFVQASNVPDGGQWLKLSANPEECAEIAARLEVKSIEKLEAKVHMHPKNNGHVLEITGHLNADVTQECSVTLDPVTSHVEDEFSAWYANYDQAASFTRAQHDLQARLTSEEQPMMEERDDPEPMVNGQVDVADLVVQYLSLAINPYLRDSEVVTPDDSAKKVVTQGVLRPNPFAALKNWRPKD